METVTAVIPAMNEEKNIGRCLESVRWCDKIIVMWMGSDRTGEIARQIGAEVVEMNKSAADDFTAVQKNINWAIGRCTTDWLLRIDADEVCTPELKKEIQQVLELQGSKGLKSLENSDFNISNISNFSNIPNFVAYGVPRKQYFWGGFMKGGDWAYDRLVRFFRPQHARYDISLNVHEQFVVNGPVGYLKNPLEHYSHPTLKDARDKFQKYTSMQVRDLKETKIAALFKMLCLPPYVFLRWMFWHNGWKDGLRGIVAGVYRGWYEYLLYSKYLRSKSSKSQ